MRTCSTCHVIAVIIVAALTAVHSADDVTVRDPGWGHERVDEVSRSRGKICLNGWWRFAPALDQVLPAGDADFGWARVPGSWGPVTDTVSAHVKTGQSKIWAAFNPPADCARAWYRRELTIPERWKDRSVWLKVDRVATDARIYIDGQPVGDIHWPRGEVELTAKVSTGRTIRLDMLVVASATAGAVDKMLNGASGSAEAKGGKLDNRGLIGDVWLESRGVGGHIADVFVRTSVRRGELALDLELAGAPDDVVVSVQAYDATGSTVERSFGELENRAKDGLLTVAWPWENARLWDVGRPELYTLKIRARGAGMDDEYAVRIGFRELWLDGKEIIFNGTPIRFRPRVETPGGTDGIPQLIDAMARGIQAYGHDLLQLWPGNEDARGSAFYREHILAVCDEIGLPVQCAGVQLSTVDANAWADPKERERWSRSTDASMRRYRNHASNVMWITNSTRMFLNDDASNPRKLSGKSMAPSDYDTVWQDEARTKGESVEVIKRLDPTRPVVVHNGAPVGDFYSPNIYLNWAPMQEREEWPSCWSEEGVKPLQVTEFGMPYLRSFLRGRGGPNAEKTEPLMTEYAAIYFGPEAYAREDADYRGEIPNLFSHDQQYPKVRSSRAVSYNSLQHDIIALFTRNTWRSWRTYGVSGGMVPWGFGSAWPTNNTQVALPEPPPGTLGTWQQQVPQWKLSIFRPQGVSGELIELESGRALRQVGAATLAYLGGPPEKVTAKNHNIEAGAIFRRSAVLINDSRAEQPWVASWTATVAGKTVGEGKLSGVLATGATQVEPIDVRIPSVADLTPGQLRLFVEIAGVRHEDQVDFRVYTADRRLHRTTLSVIDPQGETSRMLALLGIATQPFIDSDASPLVVIGRGALAGENRPDLQALLAAGHDVLVMAQTPEILRDAGLRVAPVVARRLWPIPHAPLAGLTPDALADWAGFSTLVASQPDTHAHRVTGFRSFPKHVWHWGNQGAVSAAMMEKPHRSGGRPLLEGEFDLAYSPWLEFPLASGRLTLCTVDLEDQVAADPGARLVAVRLLERALARDEVPRSTVRYLGSDAGSVWLQAVGVNYESGTDLQGASLVVAEGEAGIPSEEWQQWISGGGKVLFLPSKGQHGPLGVKLKLSTTWGSLDVPNWHECLGLSASDVRRRGEVEDWLLIGGAEIGAGGQLAHRPLGKGVAMWCQLDPQALQADQRTWLRFTRWRQTRAIAQILANLGAGFAADEALVQALSGGPAAAGLYHPDYRSDFALGDDPYRYSKW